MMVCDLCGEQRSPYRRCWFGKKPRDLCGVCLGQWTIEDGEIVLKG